MGIRKILELFIVWRIVLIILLLLAIGIFPLQIDFLGGGLTNYLHNLYLWSWANFDGEHYLAIAQRGYRSLEYFYFPLYPMTVGFIAKLLNGSVVSYLKSALLISNISFLLGLGGLVKLISLDYSQRVMKTTILLLLLFPTSFYFGSVYTESLFLALAVWALYFARKGKWLSSGLSIALASATRLVGVALIPTLLLELWITKKWKTVRGIISILLSSTGILGYMYYLKMATGDPLEFLHSISIFGAQRSSTFIMLPQVFYRYVFKILPNINYNYFPVVFTTWLEFLTAVLFFIVCTLAFLASLRKLGSIKMPWSYTTFLILGYVIPTLSGSFSSLPRYVLVLFPGYILIAALINKTGKYIRYAVYFVSFVLLFISCALFVRGYWVS